MKQGSTRKRRLRLMAVALIVIVAIAAVALAVGCGGSSEPAGSSSSEPAANTEPKIVVYDTPWTVYTSLDPAKEYWNNVYQYSVYQTLTVSDADSPELVAPCLATSWEASEGGKVWTFKLREGVKFHGGDTFDSADVVFSFDRNQEIAAGAYGFIYAGYEGIEAPDANTVVITFSKPVPMPGIASACNNSFIYSKEAFEKDGEKCFEPGTETAGSGPYVTTKVTTTEITYERFPDYWGGWEGTHANAPDVAVIRKVDEAAVRIQQLQAGDAQMAAGIPVASAESLKGDESVKLLTGEWWRSANIFLNTKTQATKDIHLREALYYAFPYEQVKSLAYKDMSSLLSGPLNVSQPGNELQDQTLGVPKQDMAKAKAALAKSAYPDGGVTLLCRVDAGMQDNMQVAQLFKAALKELNITLDARYVAGSVAYADALSENPPQAMYIVEWSAFYPGCANYLQMWELSTSGYNLTYWKDEKTDALIDQALAAEATSIEESSKLCVEAAKAYSEGYPYIWAADPYYRVGIAKNIEWEGYDPLFAYTVDFYNVQVLPE